MELILRAAALLLLLSRCDAAEETCGLTGQVREGQLDKVLGVRWMLVRGFVDYDDGLVLMRHLQSSVMVFTRLEDNVTVALEEKNMVGEHCVAFYINMTTPQDKMSNHTLVTMKAGVEANDTSCVSYEDEGKADIYSPCDDCMTLIYHMTLKGNASRMLLIYRRENHTDSEELKASEQQMVELSKCLKFRDEDHFTYNGTAGLCEKNIMHEGDKCFLS